MPATRTTALTPHQVEMLRELLPGRPLEERAEIVWRDDTQQYYLVEEVDARVFDPVRDRMTRLHPGSRMSPTNPYRILDMTEVMPALTALRTGLPYSLDDAMTTPHVGREETERGSLLDRTYGIELEVVRSSRNAATSSVLAQALREAGFPRVEDLGYTHEHSNYWRVVSDSTVRNDMGEGFEVVSPVLQGEGDFAQVQRVCKVLEARELTVNKTCGLHVHLGAGDMTPSDILAIAKRYATHEDKLDAIVAPSRRGAAGGLGYCMTNKGFLTIDNDRVTDLQSLYNVADAAVRGRGAPQGDDGRYTKFNVKAYQRHRTVEFRQHQGTINAEKIEYWVRFLQQFVKTTLAKSRGTYQVAPSTDILAQVKKTYKGQTTKAWTVAHALLHAPGSGYTRRELAELAQQGETQISVILEAFRKRNMGLVISKEQRGTLRKVYKLVGPAAADMEDKLHDGVDPRTIAFFKERAAGFNLATVWSDE